MWRYILTPELLIVLLLVAGTLASLLLLQRLTPTIIIITLVLFEGFLGSLILKGILRNKKMRRENKGERK